jgi:peptidyl-prolyl cis-trans isomerase A (cyclophilin A)
VVLAIVTVVLFTSAGPIKIAVDPAKAPITATNFLRNVRRHAYDGAHFFRTVTTKPDNQPGKPADVKIDVIQAGNAPGFKADPPIAFEPTSVTGIKHLDGTVSMARDDKPVTATTEFFICIGAQPSLDDGGRRSKDHRGFAAFGRVTDGMDVVRKIHAMRSKAQMLTSPVEIRSARVVEP